MDAHAIEWRQPPTSAVKPGGRAGRHHDGYIFWGTRCMASTNSPLKRLVRTFITDFAAWLLKAQVREASPLNVELPGETLAVDQAFRVVLDDGRQPGVHPWSSLMHVEREPLSGTRWRMPPAHRVSTMSETLIQYHGFMVRHIHSPRR